jgi:hypothetical protein
MGQQCGVGAPSLTSSDALLKESCECVRFSRQPSCASAIQFTLCDPFGSEALARMEVEGDMKIID